MSTKKINPRFAVLLLLMIVAAAMRIPNAAQLTPWANFTPIGAMGLFGGAYFTSKWKAFAFPLLYGGRSRAEGRQRRVSASPR